METQLLRFISALRNNELPVSTAETLDAMEVVSAVGYGDRAVLKAALASALAKTLEDKQRFAEVFEQFFGRDSAEPTEQAAAAELDESVDWEKAAEEHPEIANAIEGQMAEIIGEQNNDAMGMAAQEAAEAVGLQDMQYSTQRGLFARRMMEQLGLEEFQQGIEALQSINAEDADRLVEWLQEGRARLEMAVRDAVERQLMLNANAAGRELQEQAIRHARLSSLEYHHMQMMPELIRKLAKKLASRHKRRSKVAKRGKLNVGKTLRRNMAYGGVPFHLYWKRIERQQPELMVLCDVSGSVSTYARFLLLFLYNLNDVLPNIKSFVFCSKMHEVTDIFDREPAERAMEIVNQKYAQGGSDYGGAFEDFAQQQMQNIKRHTTVIILGDGRTGGGFNGLPVLRQIYDRANLVLWFNPEPRSLWNTGDSAIERYQTACHYVAECNSLAKLERLLDRLLTILK